MFTGNWNYPTSIRFGSGQIKKLPEDCLSLKIKKPLLVTDTVLVKLPIIENTLDISSLILTTLKNEGSSWFRFSFNLSLDHSSLSSISKNSPLLENPKEREGEKDNFG